MKEQDQEPKFNNLALIFILLGGFLFINIIFGIMKDSHRITSSKFQELVENKQIVDEVVIIDKKRVTGFYMNEMYFKAKMNEIDKNSDRSDVPQKIPFQFETNLEVDKELLSTLKKNKIPYTFKETPNYGALFSLVLPLVILLFIFNWFRKGAGANGMGGLKNLNNGGYKRYTPNSIGITFKDVAGIEEAKQEVSEIVDYLKDPAKFVKLGAKIPKGVLLVGEPGTGKTLLAKAIASEAHVPYFYTSGSEFVEVFVGMGAKKIRDLFTQARKSAPCIIFIDEIDTVGGKRSGMSTGGHSETEQTLNQLLSEMDGFEGDSGIIVLAATNRPDVLDSALKRPGRFNREVTVGKPTMKGREAILKVHTEQRRRVPLAEDVDLKKIAQGTIGFTGAELENLINEAALLAGRANKQEVEMNDFENAIDKIIMGLENRNLTISKKEKMKTAIHEAGHTLISMMSNELDKVHKVSIIPRGRALGVTQTLPEEEATLNYSKTKCIEMIEMLMGGRIAEELFYKDEKTTGASNDIEKATHIAKNMVYSWGMSEKMGFLNYNSMPQHQFDQKHSFSEETRSEADKEVRKIINDAYESARKKLTKNKEKLKKIADMLMEKETINSDDLKSILT